MSLKWALKRFVHSARFRQIIILGTYIVPFTCPSQSKQFVNTYCYKLFINQSYMYFPVYKTVPTCHTISPRQNKRWHKMRKFFFYLVKLLTAVQDVTYILFQTVTTIHPPQTKRCSTYMASILFSLK